MKIITINNEIQPIVEHIREMQSQIKNLEGELKQYKTLLQNDYMQGVKKIVTMNDITVAQIIEQERKTLDQTRLKEAQPEIYNEFIITTSISFLKVS